MTGDELIIMSPLDQELATENEDILEWIDGLVKRSLDEHDPFIALNGLKDLRRIAKLSSLGLARGLYLMRKHWDEFGIEESFETVAYVEVGVHRHTVDRYVDVWAMYDNKLLPEQYADQIQQHNIKTQIPIGKALAQGYEIKEKDWERLANAPDQNQVAAILRDIKGQEPRKGSLQLFMNTDGEIKAFSDGDFYRVGWLDTASDAEPVQKAVNRIVSNGGILKR